MCAYLLRDFSLDQDTAWSLAKEWNRTNASPPWDETELGKKFENAKRYGTHALGAALVGKSASEPGGLPAIDPTVVRQIPGTERYTDLGNARRFVAAARGNFLFVHGWNRWLYFDGRHWVKDTKKMTHELAARVASAIQDEVKDAGADLGLQKRIVDHAVRSQKRQAIDAMVSLAGTALPDLKVGPEDFDQNPDLLNVLNGTIDLRTGHLRPHSPDDRITRLIRVAYDPNAQAPNWVRFLPEILPDEETRAFVQRAAGYSATGHVRENVLLFLYGHGRNGKGTFTRAIAGVLGPYADVAPPGLLLASRSERHPTDIADLEGKRFVSAAETGQDREWNEERLKWLTGGDALKARRMHEDWRIPFTPTHKFWIESNHDPRVRGTDRGIWSRIKKVPFLAEWREPSDAAPERAHLPVQNPRLGEQLESERAGILAWVVKGAVLWHQQGLGVPAEVREATREYQRNQDTFADFLESPELASAPRREGRLFLKDVMAVYEKYAIEYGAERLSDKAIAAELRRRGHSTEKTRDGTIVVLASSND